MTTKSPDTSKLDASTPKWPVLGVTLTDPPTVDVNGAVTPLNPADPQQDAVGHAARQARSLGRAVRMTVTDAAGVQRLIVGMDGIVTLLGQPAPSAAGKAKRTAGTARTSPGKAKAASRLPRPVRWVALAFGVITALALVVLLTHRSAPKAEAAATVQAPVPPAGQLYTEIPPPGWSQQAAWVLPVSDRTVPATDPATGITVAVTPEDRSTSDTAAQRHGPRDQWLSILGPDGATRWAFGLDSAPRFGPVITRVDGAQVALIATDDQIRYWQLDSGAETALDLPSGAKLSVSGGESVLLTLPKGQLGYLQGGAIQIVQALPRTQPAIALDGAVLVTQPDTGTWWTLRAGATPTSVTPPTPSGAGAVDKILAVTVDRVVIAWQLARPNPRTPALIIAAFHRNTGVQDGSLTTPSGRFGQPGAAFSNAGTIAAGSVLLTPTSLAVIEGFTATGVADRAYGMVQGKAAIVDANGHPVLLPDGTLIPTGAGGAFLPVVSQGKLYALRSSTAS